MKFFFILLLNFIFFQSYSQIDSVKKSPLTFNGYLDLYYAYDLGNPSTHNRPEFICSYNRHNEVNINLAYAKASYNTAKMRTSIALMAGTYANINLAQEPGVLKNIFEANIGFKLSKKNNLWIDAGVFQSHIGSESAVGIDNWNLSRSILADNTPYYESGAKISYTTKNEKWFLSALLLNGWQKISRIEGNNTPAFGHQISFKPSSGVLINSSSFIGNVFPDSVIKMRYFHDFYLQWQANERFAIQAVFDVGIQQKSKLSSNYNVWHSSAIISKYAFTKKIILAVRGEYYFDPNEVIIVSNSPNGFQTYSYSLNIDYKITDNVLWRIEGRSFTSKDKIFLLEKQPNNSNYFFITSLAATF
ncbi:MAG: porin [Bacteroidetes bacterium]|nr:porin [Bacteroidota bacterium]